MMATVSSERIQLAVDGYIREIKSIGDIADVIKEIIVAFAKHYFRWQESKSPEGEYKFNDEDPTLIIHGPKRRFTFLAMDDIISLDICKKFEWELEIKQRLKKSEISFMFGFVKHPRDESIHKSKWIGMYFGLDGPTNAKQFGVYVSYCFKECRKYGAGDYSLAIGDESAYEKKWSEGDRFRLLVDFEEKTIGLMYNDKDMGIIYTDIPDKIVPTLCACSNIELKCNAYVFK